MAVAYPEGECFFNRNGLRSPQRDGYDANNPRHFHESMLIEYLWNIPADINPSFTRRHDRSAYSVVWPNIIRNTFGCYHHLPIGYGPNEHNIRRRVQHELCINPRTFDDYHRGASAESWFMNILLPTEAERWVWIDLLAPIRAIYLPLAYTASEGHQQLSGWVQVSFSQTRTVHVWLHDRLFWPRSFHSTYGLGTQHDVTVGFDVYGLMQALALPRQLRKDNVYSSKLIKMVSSASLWASSSLRPTTLHARYNISWLTVANSNFGLDLQWRPAQKSSWLENFLKNVLTNLVGMIPVIGPVLAILFPLAWTMITDIDAAFDELKNLLPGIDLADRIIREKILKSSEEVKQYLPPGWESMTLPAQPKQLEGLSSGEADDSKPGKPQALEMSLMFVMAGEVLAKRHLVPPPEDESPRLLTEMGRSGQGEILLTNPPNIEPTEEEERESS